MNAFSDAVWVVSFAVEVYILARALTSKEFLKYLSLNVFVAAMAFRDVSCFLVYREYGFSSLQFTYAYYYSDALLTILMYLAIMHLYHQVFEEMHVGKYLRGATVGLLAATALFSYAVVASNVGHFTGRFVVELSQNMYFVGLVLTYLLWAAVFKLRETRTRLVQLVLALGIYFSATAAAYAFRNMFPSLRGAALFVGPLLGVFLVVAWAYTFTKVPEDARQVPAAVVSGIASRGAGASRGLAPEAVTNR